MGTRTLEKASGAKSYLDARALGKNTKELEVGSWSLEVRTTNL